MLLKALAHSLQAVDVVLRLFPANQETVSLVRVTRFVDLVENLRLTLFIDIVALLSKDRVRRRRLAYDDLITVGDGHLADTLPPVGFQMLCLDVSSPTAKVNTSQTLEERDTWHRPDLVGTCCTLLNVGFVDAAGKQLLYPIALGQFLQS